MKQDRRGFLTGAGAATAALALGGLPFAARAATDKLKIGVVGSGRVGGTLGGVWVKAGHEVMLREPERRGRPPPSAKCC